MLSVPRFSAALAFGFAGFLAFTNIASADHAWGPYHWARTTPSFTLQLGDNVTSTWDSYLRAASTDWSTSNVLDTTVVAGKGGTSCKAQTGRAEICNKKYGNNGWLGLAQIWISGEHITKGIVKMNDTYFSKTAYNKPSWRALVLCQEIGHIFGLDHQDESFDNANLGSCMDYTSDPNPNQHPNAHDYEMLEAIYAHLDTTTTVAQSTSSSRARGLAAGRLYFLPFDFAIPEIQTPSLDIELGDNPANWGAEISRSVSGNASVFSKKVGNEEILTHVFWAEPRN